MFHDLGIYCCSSVTLSQALLFVMAWGWGFSVYSVFEYVRRVVIVVSPFFSSSNVPRAQKIGLFTSIG